MNRNDFLNMLGSRAPVNRSILGEVYELVDLFPYFQSAHMLLLKGLKDNDDIKFEKQLRSSAVYIADREVLYYLLKEAKSTETYQVKEKTEPETEILSNSESATETQQTVIESAKNSELLITEYEKDYEQPTAEDLNVNSVSIPVHTVLMPSSSENEDSADVMLLMDENDQTDEEKVFFMDPGFSTPDKSDLLELDTDIADAGPFFDEQESRETASNVEIKGSKRQLQTELIDKFIIANPRIEPIKEKSSQQPEDLPIAHVEEKGSFVTETLARIYINQGYYSRAIDIYEKLSLKFPEKSSYFAAQIEKVKEYIKK
jgi:hypothetical protein